MTDQEIKVFVAKHVLNNIKDQAVQNIIRRVLFNDKNKISWQHFYTVVVDQMPELKNAGVLEMSDKVNFKKGDVVVAKDGFLNPGETLKDTLGVVVSYNPDNDYLVIGEVFKGNHALNHTFSARGEFYRLATNKELKDFGALEPVPEKVETRAMIKSILEGGDIRSILCQEQESSSDLKKMLYARLKMVLNNWNSYFGDEDQWLDIVTSVAEEVWGDLNVESDLPSFLKDIADIDDHVLTQDDVDAIKAAEDRYLEFIGDGSVKKVNKHNNYIEFVVQPQYGNAYQGLFGVINKDGYPDVYNSDGFSCFRDFKEEHGLTVGDINRIRKG